MTEVDEIKFKIDEMIATKAAFKASQARANALYAWHKASMGETEDARVMLFAMIQVEMKICTVLAEKYGGSPVDMRIEAYDSLMELVNVGDDQ